PHHARQYSIASPRDGERPGYNNVALTVKRVTVDHQGRPVRGVCSNYLCDLKLGDTIEFSGPVGYPFEPPASRKAGLLMIGMGTGIAPFRALIRHIYEKLGSWEGKVRLFYGAKTGLEMLYMNDANKDLAQYVYQPTFKAFQAVSPRPVFDAPIELDQALKQNAAEVWEMMQAPDTHLYLAGVQALFYRIEAALTEIAGSADAWQRVKEALKGEGRWHEVLY
ncbi:MAG: FAD-binding oxidoreductase, partial [Rhodocyclaceae bacterium]|nr:FAD-binding oxidoreductase [Rhodocyclaceae bacterium]